MKVVPADKIIADSQRLAERIDALLTPFEEKPPAFAGLENNSLVLHDEKEEVPDPPGYYNFDGILEEAQRRARRRKARRKSLLRILAIVLTVIVIFILLFRALSHQTPVEVPTSNSSGTGELPGEMPSTPSTTSTGGSGSSSGSGNGSSGGSSSGGGRSSTSVHPPPSEKVKPPDTSLLPVVVPLVVPLVRDCSEVDPQWTTYPKLEVLPKLLRLQTAKGDLSDLTAFQEVYQECKVFLGHQVPDFVRDCTFEEGEVEEERILKSAKEAKHYFEHHAAPAYVSSSTRNRLKVQIDPIKLFFTPEFIKALLLAMQEDKYEHFFQAFGTSVVLEHTFAAIHSVGFVSSQAGLEALMPCLTLSRWYASNATVNSTLNLVRFEGDVRLRPWLQEFWKRNCHRHHHFESKQFFEPRYEGELVEYVGAIERMQRPESLNILFEQLSLDNLALIATQMTNDSLQAQRLKMDMIKDPDLERSTRELVAPLQRQVTKHLPKPLPEQEQKQRRMPPVAQSTHLFALVGASLARLLPSEMLYFRITVKSAVFRYQSSKGHLRLTDLGLIYDPVWLPWMEGKVFVEANLPEGRPCHRREMECYEVSLSGVEMIGISVGKPCLSNDIKWLVQLHVRDRRTGQAFDLAPAIPAIGDRILWNRFDCPRNHRIVAFELAEGGIRGECL